jgi:hypothetical protein
MNDGRCSSVHSRTAVLLRNGNTKDTKLTAFAEELFVHFSELVILCRLLGNFGFGKLPHRMTKREMFRCWVVDRVLDVAFSLQTTSQGDNRKNCDRARENTAETQSVAEHLSICFSDFLPKRFALSFALHPHSADSLLSFTATRFKQFMKSLFICFLGPSDCSR